MTQSNDDPAPDATEQTLLADTIKRIEDFVDPDTAVDYTQMDWAPVVEKAHQTHPDGLTLYLGRHTYLFNSPLHIHTCLRLMGATGSGFDSSSVLRFQNGGDGIIVHSPSTARPLGLSGSGQGSILEGLQILGNWGGFQRDGTHPDIGPGNGNLGYALGLGTNSGNSVSPRGDNSSLVSMLYGCRIGEGQVFVDSGDGPPAEGTGNWSQGDRILNRHPAPGDPAGWILTSAGWRGFGRIDS